MPRFAVIGIKEKNSINKIFTQDNCLLFKHSFENLRKKSDQVEDFKRKFTKKFRSFFKEILYER